MSETARRGYSHRMPRAGFEQLKAAHEDAVDTWREARAAHQARPTGANAARLIETWRAMARARVAMMSPEEA